MKMFENSNTVHAHYMTGFEILRAKQHAATLMDT